ncbi:MAG: universal stress protein UspA-like protein [Bacteroidetes bacterium]|nr:MAG: universal stress protein UspA-like protein [Bacteroidota bacterium]
MSTKKIIVPVDFTTASDQAIKQAINIALKSGCSISLIHVIGEIAKDSAREDLVKTRDQLQALTEKTEKAGVRCETTILEGSIFSEIPAIANNPENFIVVMGTHGIQGFKQKLLGADILKLARKISIPCLIVQDECINQGLNPIVLPVGGHDNFSALAKAVATLAGIFDSEVIIYSVIRKGEPESEKIRNNTQIAEKIFSENFIRFRRVREELTIISVGFARQTLQYSDATGAGLIGIMSVKSEEHYYFAQADKETMVNNRHNIPILCVSGLENF